jgi:hypothetical protein
MGDVVQSWSEKEWQKYSNELLAVHYALMHGSYQRIPDIGGDHGLEGVTDCGCAYQAYADQGSKTHKERVDKQKEKIRTDLNKLFEYKDFWTDFFVGKEPLRRWTLIVPDFADKEVVKYARQRARELVKRKLPFISDKLEACVKTADDYPAAKLIARDPHLPKAPPISVSPQEVADFKVKDAEFVTHIDTKLKKVANLTANERVTLREQLLVFFLHSSNYLDGLRQQYPTQWEELDTLIDTLGESLVTEGLLDTRAPEKRLTETRASFANTLKDDFTFLGETERLQISWGTLSKWLGECSLDFRRTSDAP